MLMLILLFCITIYDIAIVFAANVIVVVVDDVVAAIVLRVCSVAGTVPVVPFILLLLLTVDAHAVDFLLLLMTLQLLFPSQH